MICKKIIIMAGGSGGHVFPGLSIACDLIKKGWEIHWIGKKNSIESKVIPKYGIKITFINIKGFINADFTTLISLPVRLLFSYFKVKKVIKDWSPDVILGMGGYVSGPGAIAAWNLKIPLIIHEQNKVAGITNKFLSKISTKNIQAFSGTLKNAIVSGNPIRENIVKIPKPIHRFKNRKGPLRILIMGGSQGSLILNKILPKVCFLLKKKITIWHQIGNFSIKKIEKKYNQYGFYNYKIDNFIEHINLAYRWADLIICRSGALTVSEISVVGLAAIFIPYPHKDKQQYLNALELHSIGAAQIVDQLKLNARIIVQIIQKLNRKKLLIMSKKAYSLGVRNSALKISSIISKIANQK
ncbi:undecaprenyldiphospho-muramoylpentapeptide beta-N-acetylglucosaminyltransferase [Buchnera aphidicola (Muscaphis stroyani)]|uniref:UDP-N-acetylglucosamine--N-acetylmuramyl-(pentapeptide) pyrophosphoryl-undecaprenol N-acetylglucosamine transferase n=1 Tax=Buchnera aphidicola (Muscaphis stroyani) TaxID=1241869 RepID=A0A4D6YEQ9_9GAMM|nr:undecaprenyldiphospho-muramoylpentapeptide beta-N-acetylglucosaminyltransferase [Buchnera aphidicola]QCI24304.1 undecaprenyldiphospho-muramoylpentapeptide beta-N-acetylglucosaminyltransferase [Buchnera aphidicola (Muscaphis stroyani)]